MIELDAQINQILRTNQHPSSSTRRPQRQAAPRPEGPPREAAPAEGEPNPISVINFEYLPSGRLHMNQEEKNHLVDFFR